MLTSETSISEPLGWSGEETGFAVGFQALDPEHVLARYTPDEGDPVSLAHDVHFTAVIDAAGNVLCTPLAMPEPSGTVVFYRRTPPLQEVDFVNLGAFAAEVHERIADRAMMIAAELRRDLLEAQGVTISVSAGEVTYSGTAGGGNVGAALDNLKSAVDGKAASVHSHTLASLADVTFGALDEAADGQKVTYDHGAGKFILSASDISGPALIDAINDELGGTVWQLGGEGGGSGDITNASNVGSAGSGLFKQKSGTQLQFRNLRGQNGVTAALNGGLDTIDLSADQTFLDGIYARSSGLALVATTGAYADLGGKPTLGALAAKNSVAAGDIDNAAVTNGKLANMAAGSAKGRAVGAGTGAPQDLTGAELKAIAGLGNVDNTSDASKPVSSAQAAAIAAKADFGKVPMKTYDGFRACDETDVGYVLNMSASSNVQLPNNSTVPAINVGDWIAFLNGSSGTVNINAESGVTRDMNFGNRLTGRGDIGIAYKTGNNRWSIAGQVNT